MSDNRIKQEIYELDKAVFDALRYADADMVTALDMVESIFHGINCPAITTAVKSAVIARFQAASIPINRDFMS